MSWCRIRSWTSTGPSFSSESATRRRSAGTSPWPGPFGFACEKCRIGHESPSPDACPPSAGVMSEKIRDLRRARRARRIVRLSGGRELPGEQARPAARPGAIAVSVRPARRCKRWMPLRGSLGAWAGVPVLSASVAPQGAAPARWALCPEDRYGHVGQGQGSDGHEGGRVQGAAAAYEDEDQCGQDDEQLDGDLDVVHLGV